MQAVSYEANVYLYIVYLGGNKRDDKYNSGLNETKANKGAE